MTRVSEMTRCHCTGSVPSGTEEGN